MYLILYCEHPSYKEMILEVSINNVNFTELPEYVNAKSPDNKRIAFRIKSGMLNTIKMISHVINAREVITVSRYALLWLIPQAQFFPMFLASQGRVLQYSGWTEK